MPYTVASQVGRPFFSSIGVAGVPGASDDGLSIWPGAAAAGPACCGELNAGGRAAAALARLRCRCR